MTNIIILFLCFFSGIALKKTKIFPANSHLSINLFLIYIALPLITLYFIPKIEINTGLLYPILVPWIQIIFAILLFAFLGKKWNLSKALIGSLTLCAGFGNTSFAGIPIISSLYGEEGIKTVILVDQPGSFVAISTLGIAIAGYYSSGKSSWKDIVNRILRFPPFYAFIIGVLLNIFSVTIPAEIDKAFLKIGETTVPLAMFSVGFQLKIQRESKHWNYLWLGLLYKLILAPLFFFVLYMLVFKQRGEMIEISILEAGMAPMVTAAIIATAYRLKPQFSSLMVSIGLIFSFFTIAGWYLLFQIL
ncbi:MAG: AEC family transporter [Flavobacteriaceae bacterium]|nr:AEC family transporter [Flavobacteriaceae bacterium]